MYINYWFNGGHFGFYQKTRLSPGRIWCLLCVVLNSSTEANYAEKNLLTFLSIRYFGICALKNAVFHIFRYIETLTLKITSV